MRPANDNKFFYVQTYVFILVGKWFLGFNNRIQDRIYSVYSLMVELFFFLMTQQLFVSAVVFRACPERVIELLACFLLFENSSVCSLLTKRDNARKIFNYIFDYEKKELDPSTAHIYLEYVTLNKRVTQIFIVLTGSVGAIWYTSPILKTTINTESIISVCPREIGLNFQMWYPFDLYNKCHGLTVMIDVTFFVVAIAHEIYNRVIIVSFMIFILGQLKILQEMIRGLQDIDPKSTILRTIINCIKKHQEIIRLMLLMDKACKEIVLIGFFANSLSLAAFLIKLLMEDNLVETLRSFGALLMNCTQLFCFFWFANEIQVQSIEISDVIYNETNWVNYDKEAQQNLLIMMIRSQRPLVINAAAIGDMSLDVFTRIMKLCYSVVTFFNAMYI